MDVAAAEQFDDVGGVARVVLGLEEVAADPDVRLLVDRFVQGADQDVFLQFAVGALFGGLLPLPDPAFDQRVLVLGDDVDRLVHRQVVVVDLLAVVFAAALLVGHPGGAEQQRGHGVAVLGGEEVVRVVVAVLQALVVEARLQRRTDQVLDLVQGEVGDLVVDRVLVGWEEVPGRLLMGVDEEEARVFEDGVQRGEVDVLRLVHQVAVGVERPGGRAGVVVAAVGVPGRVDEDVQRPQAHRVRAVGPGRQLVEHPHRCLAPRGLVAMRGLGDPGQSRPVVRAEIGEGRVLGDDAGAHVPVPGRVGFDVGDVLGRADDRVLEPAPTRGRADIAHQDADARVVRRRRGQRFLVFVELRGDVAAGGAAAEPAEGRVGEASLGRELGEGRDRRVVLDRLRAFGRIFGGAREAWSDDAREGHESENGRHEHGPRHSRERIGLHGSGRGLEQRRHQRDLRLLDAGRSTAFPPNRTAALNLFLACLRAVNLSL